MAFRFRIDFECARHASDSGERSTLVFDACSELACRQAFSLLRVERGHAEAGNALRFILGVVVVDADGESIIGELPSVSSPPAGPPASHRPSLVCWSRGIACRSSKEAMWPVHVPHDDRPPRTTKDAVPSADTQLTIERRRAYRQCRPGQMTTIETPTDRSRLRENVCSHTGVPMDHSSHPLSNMVRASETPSPSLVARR